MLPLLRPRRSSEPNTNPARSRMRRNVVARVERSSHVSPATSTRASVRRRGYALGALGTEVVLRLLGVLDLTEHLGRHPVAVCDARREARRRRLVRRVQTHSALIARTSALVSSASTIGAMTALCRSGLAGR